MADGTWETATVTGSCTQGDCITAICNGDHWGPSGVWVESNVPRQKSTSDTPSTKEPSPTPKVAKARRKVRRNRAAIIEELEKLVPEGTELSFYEKIGTSLCTGSSGGINHCIEGLRHDAKGGLTAFGNDEDASCGASVGEIEDDVEELSSEDLVSLLEMAERATKA